MANPALVSTTKNQWTKVATAILSGNFFPYDSRSNYFITYKLTGESVPSNASKSPGIIMTEQIELGHSEPVDVYVYADNDNGKVLVHA